MNWKHALITLAAACAVVVALVTGTHAQVGKSLGVVDANTATEAALLKMPHMTPAIVKNLIAARNFATAVDLNKFLLGAGLTQPQAMEFYRPRVHPCEPEHRHARRDHADSKRRRAHGARIQRVSPVEDVRAVSTRKSASTSARKPPTS